ncbi:MAG: metal-sensitive transcriptional regulator [Patescibacteria group bacterium]
MNPLIKKRSLRRLKIICGQVHGLERMIENECYCIDLINQSLAIREALLSLEKLIMENHLATHVVEQIKAGQSKKAVKEVLSIYKFANR